MKDDESRIAGTLDDAVQGVPCSNGYANGKATSLSSRTASRVYARSESLTRDEPDQSAWWNLPLTVKEAARFLGVSPQTVYLWVERKQIPHFRVMGRNRLQQKRRVRRRYGIVELGNLKATSVHQEFRVLRRILSVAVKKKLMPNNPCSGVEFPVMVKSLFRPHYMTWSEQTKVEQRAPAYLRNVVRIIAETGLRIYKELVCMRKEQVDIANKVVFVADSKTPTGVSEVPLTDIAAEAFQNQLKLAGPALGTFQVRGDPMSTNGLLRGFGKGP
jgi:excisionase family DNA binding protein